VDLRVRATETGSELTLVHADLHDQESQASHRGGWGGALDKLQARLDGEARL
jgi:hypothetical protein